MCATGAPIRSRSTKGVSCDEVGELPEVLTPQNLGRIWASSIGLSFCVGAEIDVLSVTAAWGQYARQETEDDEGRKRTAWTREPKEFRPEIRLDRESPRTSRPAC